MAEHCPDAVAILTTAFFERQQSERVRGITPGVRPSRLGAQHEAEFVADELEHKRRVIVSADDLDALTSITKTMLEAFDIRVTDNGLVFGTRTIPLTFRQSAVLKETLDA